VFDWDDANASHLARHRIEPSEVEELFGNYPAIRAYEVVEGEDRWTAVGATASLRVLVVIFTMRDDRIRAVTGWEADRRTKKQYFSGRGT
jgi:uncharacterized DUF497 family protein